MSKNIKNLNKTAVAVSVALVALLMLSTVAMVIPTASAQQKTEAWAYVAAVPKVAQVGQTILITGWTSPIPGATGAPASDPFKSGYSLTFTKPDGTTETRNPLANAPMQKSYQDGSFFMLYTPNQEGKWSVTFTWAGDAVYDAVTSEPYHFEVITGESPLKPAEDIPIPTHYWTRPVAGDIRGIGEQGYLSNWVMRGSDSGNSYYNPNSKAPETSHVLWTYNSWNGGVIGGIFGDLSIADAYSAGKNGGPIVMMGILYEDIPRTNVYRAIDIFTGQEIWRKAFAGSVTFDLQPAYADPEVGYDRGFNAIIYERTSGKVTFYDALNAEVFAGGSFAGESITDPNVGITTIHRGWAYYTSGGYLLKWHPNIPGANLNATNQWFTTKEPMNKTAYRVRVPTGASAPSLFWEDIGISSNGQTGWNLTTGTVMWNRNDSYNVAGDIIPRTASNGGYTEGSSCAGEGKFYLQAAVVRRTIAIDLYTGDLAWWSDQRDYPYGSFTAYQMGVGQGKVYTVCYDGHVWAYNTNDGSLAWKFYSGDTAETPYGTYSWWAGVAIADGKVYAATGEHSATNPQKRGNRLYCIDDNTGKEVWHIGGSWGGKSVADGMLFAYHENSGLLFAFGKGDTATTVSVSNPVAVSGSTVLITGTVTDQSPGQKGTPAVSEESMTAQMEYLHMQRPKPTNNTGVPVQIFASAPDGHLITVGTTTTDGYGNFAIEWTVPSTGIYRVSASFAGDKSYFPSDAGTTFTAVQAGQSPSVTTSPGTSESPGTTTSPGTTAEVTPSAGVEEPGSPQTDTLLIVVAAVVVIAVVAAVALLMRKRA